MGNVKQIKPKQSVLANVVLLICAIILVSGGVEIGLRIFDLPKKITSGWKGRGQWDKNQLGFRGQSIVYNDNDFVVLLIGDSQVEANGLPSEATPELRLQHYLNSYSNQDTSVKVFSLGTSGYGQDQQYLMMKEYFKYFRADLVLLWFTTGNDVWNNIFPTHWPKNGHPKPTFLLKDGNLVGPNVDFGTSVFNEKLKISELLHRALIRFELFSRPSPLNDDLWEPFLPKAYVPFSKAEGTICYDWQEYWDKGAFKNENLNNEKSHFAFSLVPRSPRMDYGINLTSKLLLEMENLASSNQANFSVFYKTTPSENIGCDTFTQYHKLNDNYYKTSPAQFEKNMNDITRGLQVYSLPVKVSPWRISKTDPHLNQIANDSLMFDLSKAIIPTIFSN